MAFLNFHLCVVFILLLAMATEESSATTTKTVFLIRHAESEENRRIASLSRCFKHLSRFSLPTYSDVYASTELLNVMAQVDSNVSEIGTKQIADMGEKLRDADFLTANNVKLVAHSPLLRAQETSQGMLGCRANTAKADSVDRVVQTDLLIEKTPREWTPMYSRTFKQRIASFEDWLFNQPETSIAIVGHSQFFKAMLGLNFKFENCDVWEVQFDLSKRDSLDSSEADDKKERDHMEASAGLPPPQWYNLKQLYSCDVKSSSKEAWGDE